MQQYDTSMARRLWLSTQGKGKCVRLLFKMRSGLYYLYLDLFVFGRYVAFVAAFTVLFTTLLSLIFCLVLVLRPVPVPLPQLDLTQVEPTHTQLIGKNFTYKKFTYYRQMRASAPISIPAAGLAILELAAVVPLVMRPIITLTNSIRSTGPPARGAIPISWSMAGLRPCNYFSSFAPTDGPAGVAMHP
jgi:hypothetical protein